MTLDARSSERRRRGRPADGTRAGSARRRTQSTATATVARARCAHSPTGRSDDAPDITIAIGSCFFLAAAEPPWNASTYGGGYEIFDAIAAKAPDLMVWLGDNLYFQPPDELDPASMAARYRRQRALPSLQRLLVAAPQLAIWDDHDYGPNDADMSYVLKAESLALFRRYWANPSYGLPDAPGVFGRARWGDVDVFLLDDRWYRSANRSNDEPGKTMFGAQQLAWLRNALVYSRATLKLVVNGSQVWNRANRFEGLNHFTHEQKALADWLIAQRVEGVMFASGDRHFTELLRIERPGAYPLFEFTSSPLTSRPGRIRRPPSAPIPTSCRYAGRQAPVRADPRHRSGQGATHRARKLRPERHAVVAARAACAGFAFQSSLTPQSSSCRRCFAYSVASWFCRFGGACS